MLVLRDFSRFYPFITSIISGGLKKLMHVVICKHARTSQKHLRTKVTADLHLANGKRGKSGVGIKQ